MKFEYKGFEVERLVRPKTIEFYDKIKAIQCYKIRITYPKYKYNVMINHEPINILMESFFYYAKTIKYTSKEFIDDFLEKNKQYFEVE